MTELQLSPDGELYTREQKDQMWLMIHAEEKCPQCGAKKSMLEGPHGGMAVNIMCSECKTVFWTTPIEGFGAYPIARHEKK